MDETPQARPVTGGCLCGAVRYRAEAYLDLAYYCHCGTCQKSSGQPFEIGVVVKAGTLVFNDEHPKYFDSSEFGRRGFCAQCGSGIEWRSEDPGEAWATNLLVCSLDHPEDVRPAMHMFFDRRVPWFDVKDDLPRTTAAEADAIMDRVKVLVGDSRQS